MKTKEEGIWKVKTSKGYGQVKPSKGYGQVKKRKGYGQEQEIICTIKQEERIWTRTEKDMDK